MSGCPVMKQHTNSTAAATDWPKAINLDILHQQDIRPINETDFDNVTQTAI
jgi:hypothetical protein